MWVVTYFFICVCFLYLEKFINSQLHHDFGVWCNSPAGCGGTWFYVEKLLRNWLDQLEDLKATDCFYFRSNDSGVSIFFFLKLQYWV